MQKKGGNCFFIRKVVALPVLARYNYEQVMENAREKDSSGKFVEFLLKAIYDALCEIVDTEQVTKQVIEQVEKLLEA